MSVAPAAQARRVRLLADRPLIRRSLIGLACVLLGAPGARAQGRGFPAGTGAVMPDSLGPGVLRQCTRRAPQLREFWQPQDSLIRSLEDRLLPLLDSILPLANLRGQRVRTPPSTAYHRQYLGVVQDGRRLVYVNGFQLNTHAERDLGPDYWCSRPIVVCDGGAEFFGVLYDATRGRFERLEFNDAFGGPISH